MFIILTFITLPVATNIIQESPVVVNNLGLGVRLDREQSSNTDLQIRLQDILTTLDLRL